MGLTAWLEGGGIPGKPRTMILQHGRLVWNAKPLILLARPEGFEPPTPRSESRRFRREKSKAAATYMGNDGGHVAFMLQSALPRRRRRTPFNASRGLRQLVTAEFPQRRWQRVTRRHVHSDRPPGALGVMIREGKIAENLARSHRVRWHPKVYGPKWRTAAQRLVPVRKV